MALSGPCHFCRFLSETQDGDFERYFGDTWRSNAPVLIANPPLSHEKPTRCRWSEHSDAEGQHRCCRSTCIVPIAAEGHSIHPPQRMINGASAIGSLCRQLTFLHHSQSHGAACGISASVGRDVSGRAGMNARLARFAG